MCCFSKLILALFGVVALADEAAVAKSPSQLRGGRADRALQDATAASNHSDPRDKAVSDQVDDLEVLENQTFWAMTANLTACEQTFFEFTDEAECLTESGVDAKHECGGTCHKLACSMESACPAGSEIVLIQRGDSSRELEVDKINASEVQELIQELSSVQTACPCSSKRRLQRRGFRGFRRGFGRRGFGFGRRGFRFRRVGFNPLLCVKFGWCRFR